MSIRVGLLFALLAIALISIILSSGCLQIDYSDDTLTSQPGSADWQDIVLTDVATGNTFRISDFRGKPILLESFAVWCPTCL